jgi:hypothetical protein
MAPVVSEKIENDENIPKMLCQMDNHLGKLGEKAEDSCLLSNEIQINLVVENTK